MANNLRLSNAAASAAAGDGSSAGLRGFIGSDAVLKFYAGNQSATPENAPSGTLLAALTINGAFGAASNGTIATTSVQTGTAAADGVVGCFMLFKADGVTPVCDGIAGSIGCDINFDYTNWVSGNQVSLSSFSINIPPH